MDNAPAATHFTEVFECFRCAGFKRAFSLHPGVNGGRCLLCNGALRTVRTSPVAKMALSYQYPAARRAEAIETIARALTIIGAPAAAVDGRRVSPWGYSYDRKSDTMNHLAAAFSIAPDDVRVRGWAAVTAKVRATLGDRGEAVIATLRRRTAAFSGLAEDQVGAWVGEAGEAGEAARRAA
jgi:hypothetical protein